MSADTIKRMDIAEFRRLGFLQEVNRRFFHPHGLALEVTVVTETFAEAEERNPWASGVVRQFSEALAQTSLVTPAEANGVGDRLHEAAVELADAMYPVGSTFLSGVWDYREDPEGVYYGERSEESIQKAADVAAERLKHVLARGALFGVITDPDVELHEVDLEKLARLGVDIEPLTWEATDAA